MCSRIEMAKMSGALLSGKVKKVDEFDGMPDDEIIFEYCPKDFLSGEPSFSTCGNVGAEHQKEKCVKCWYEEANC